MRNTNIQMNENFKNYMRKNNKSSLVKKLMSKNDVSNSINKRNTDLVLLAHKYANAKIDALYEELATVRVRSAIADVLDYIHSSTETYTACEFTETLKSKAVEAVIDALEADNYLYNEECSEEFLEDEIQLLASVFDDVYDDFNHYSESSWTKNCIVTAEYVETEACRVVKDLRADKEQLDLATFLNTCTNIFDDLLQYDVHAQVSEHMNSKDYHSAEYELVTPIFNQIRCERTEEAEDAVLEIIEFEEHEERIEQKYDFYAFILKYIVDSVYAIFEVAEGSEAVEAISKELALEAMMTYAAQTITKDMLRRN